MELIVQRTVLLFVVWMLHCNQCIAQETGSIIPLYVYPKTDDGGNAWQPLYNAYKAFPIKTWAIVNVNSGPGNKTWRNPDFVNGIRELHAAGINTLGYVRTDYTRQSQATVRAEILQWKQFYNPNGIFFDEMAYDDNNQKVQYYQNVSRYAKSQGFTYTVGNPGTATIPKYFNTVDNIVIFEKDTGFPSNDLICGQNTNRKGRSSVSIIPYNIKNLDTTAVANMKTCAGFIYVTSDYGANPWDELPNYLTQLFQVLKG